VMFAKLPNALWMLGNSFFFFDLTNCPRPAIVNQSQIRRSNGNEIE
jgi:hypothetical protein